MYTSCAISLWPHSYFYFSRVTPQPTIFLSVSLFLRTSYACTRVSCFLPSVPLARLLAALLFQPTQRCAILEICSSFLTAVICGLRSHLFHEAMDNVASSSPAFRGMKLHPVVGSYKWALRHTLETKPVRWNCKMHWSAAGIVFTRQMFRRQDESLVFPLTSSLLFSFFWKCPFIIDPNLWYLFPILSSLPFLSVPTGLSHHINCTTVPFVLLLFTTLLFLSPSLLLCLRLLRCQRFAGVCSGCWNEEGACAGAPFNIKWLFGVIWLAQIRGLSVPVRRWLPQRTERLSLSTADRAACQACVTIVQTFTLFESNYTLHAWRLIDWLCFVQIVGRCERNNSPKR